MRHPAFIEIDGKRFAWRELVQRRREELHAAAKAVQPALFELRDDRRPACERTAAKRYQEPSLFTLLDAEAMSKEQRFDIYQRITNQIVFDLEQGVRPWMKPWSAGNAEGRVTRPLRGNGVPYRGINVLML